MSLFGPAISWNEDDNIAGWQPLSVVLFKRLLAAGGPTAAPLQYHKPHFITISVALRFTLLNTLLWCYPPNSFTTFAVCVGKMLKSLTHLHPDED